MAKVTERTYVLCIDAWFAANVLCGPRRYETLAEEVKIGDHYLRLLLEDDPKNTKIHNPVEFFNDLYHRFLLTTVPAMKAMCLQALAIVYGQCYEEIGNFNDTEYIVTMLNRCEDNMERDRLLEFLAVLLRNTKNVKLFIDAGGLRALTDLVTLAHLHTTRANVPLQNDMIQASNSQLADDEAEWYYSMSKDSKERKGPIGFVKLKEMYVVCARPLGCHLAALCFLLPFCLCIIHCNTIHMCIQHERARAHSLTHSLPF